MATQTEQTRLADIRAANNGDGATDIGFVLGLMDRAFDEVRRLQKLLPDQAVAKKYAAEAAMKCKEERFQLFLLGHPKLGAGAVVAAAEGQVETAVEAAQRRVRSLTGVKSLKELSEDANAARAWNFLRNDFVGWNRNGTYRDQPSRVGAR